MKRNLTALVIAVFAAGIRSEPASCDAQVAVPVVHDGPSGPALAWRAAMQAGDLGALRRMHDAGTIAFPPNTEKVTGADAILKNYADLFAAYEVHVTFVETHYVEVAPLVVSWGISTLLLHPKAGGADIVSRARFTDAAIRGKDGWVYVVDHASRPKGAD